jgi:regulator of protease activity HflC (stomatin/prohibitin superfamily)
MSEPVLDPLSPPRYLARARSWDQLLTLAMIIATCGTVFVITLVIDYAWNPANRDQAVLGLAGIAITALLIATASLLTIWLLGAARRRLLAALEEQRAALNQDRGGAKSLFTNEAPVVASEVERRSRELTRTAGWIQICYGLPVLAAAGLVAVRLFPHPGASTGELAGGIICMALAFPLVLLERKLTLTSREELVDAPATAAIFRLVIAALLVSGGCALLHAQGLQWTIWIERTVALVLLLVDLELMLRAVTWFFLPDPPCERAGTFVDSVIARLMPGGAVQGAGIDHLLKERFNIDWSRSWALSYLRTIASPLALVLLVISWLLSGITILSPVERGILERLGRPIGVLKPGLHLHLPWPFGAVRRLEFDVLHDVSLGMEGESAAAGLITADADTPASADRLWETVHPAESAFIVPSTGTGARGQGFQLVNTDVRVLYRIGLSDQQALDSCYQVDQPEELVKACAARLFDRAFAIRTLPQVIGEDRDQLSNQVHSELQELCDRHHSGVEITAVIIDSIHPPTGAAVAYHSVQAAEIITATDVAQARSTAVNVRSIGEKDAAHRQDEATARAVETMAEASIEKYRFEADVETFRRYPTVMRFERWLEALSKSLNGSQMTIIDHRIETTEAPLIDLRPPTRE